MSVKISPAMKIAVEYIRMTARTEIERLFCNEREHLGLPPGAYPDLDAMTWVLPPEVSPTEAE